MTDATLLAQATEILLAERKLVSARKALRRLAELVTPAERARVKRRLAHLEIELGDYHQGIADYRAALALSPDSRQLALELCQQLRALGDHEAALEVIQPFSRHVPELIQVEAELLVKLRRFEEAKALALKIRNVDLLIAAGAFAEAEPLLTDPAARAELASWSGDSASARELVGQALEKEPNSPRALRIRATLHLLAGEVEPAERDLARIPDDPLALIWRGEAKRRRGHWEAAWSDLDRGIEKTRGYPLGAHVSLVAMDAGRDFQGELDPGLYRELCLILRPLFEILGLETDAPRSNQDISTRLESVLVAMQGNRGPRPSFVHEGTLRPLDLPLHARFQSRAIQELLRTRPASFVIQALEALAIERPTEPTVQCHLGEVQLWLGDYTAAEHAFLRAIDLARDTRWAYVGLCASALFQNDPDEAIRWCERGEKEALPGRTQFAYRGEAYRRLGDRARAQADLLRSLELTPTRFSAWLNLALIAENPLVVGTTLATFRRHAPGLLADAELAGDRDPARLFERALAMMRGNRSSSLVTYFTTAGKLRFVPPASY